MIGSEKVREYFKSINEEDKIVVHSVKTDTVSNAAKELGCEEAQICKTMAFLVGEEAIVIAMTGDAKIDNAKYKSAFHKKAKMVPIDEVERIIGHIPGGVCPFAVNDGVKVYLDESLKRFDIVYAAAGSPETTIGVTIEEFERFSLYDSWVDVCK